MYDICTLCGVDFLTKNSRTADVATAPSQSSESRLNRMMGELRKQRARHLQDVRGLQGTACRVQAMSEVWISGFRVQGLRCGLIYGIGIAVLD